MARAQKQVEVPGQPTPTTEELDDITASTEQPTETQSDNSEELEALRRENEALKAAAQPVTQTAVRARKPRLTDKGWVI